jgi:ubiquinone/menaquinone biosynthesis C-methylase UbiE
VRYYVELARAYGGPVLELGAGSGRITIEIAKAGIEVVGAERAAPMLAQARARAAELPKAVRARISLVRADLRKLSLDGRFPLVIAPFNVLMHMYSRAEIDQALAACMRHLASIIERLASEGRAIAATSTSALYLPVPPAKTDGPSLTSALRRARDVERF